MENGVQRGAVGTGGDREGGEGGSDHLQARRAEYARGDEGEYGDVCGTAGAGDGAEEKIMGDCSLDMWQCDWCWRYVATGTSTARALHKAQDKAGAVKTPDGALVCKECKDKRNRENRQNQ